MNLFGIGTSQIVTVVKDVLVAILKWIWDKIKDWARANMAKVAIGILTLAVVILVKLLVLRVQLTPILVQAGFLSPSG